MNCPFAEQCSTAILALALPRFLILFMLIFNFPHTADPPPPPPPSAFSLIKPCGILVTRHDPLPTQQDEYKPTHYFSRVSFASRLKMNKKKKNKKKSGALQVFSPYM